MGNRYLILLLTAAITALAGTQLIYRKVPLPGNVLSWQTSVSPTPTTPPPPVPTATPTPTLKPTPRPTIKPKPTSPPSPTPKPVTQFTSQQVYEMTEKYAREYGVDANVLRHIAVCETGFNPMAKTRLYAGLYQFSAQTWISYRRKMGRDPDVDLRLNAEEAVRTAAYVISKNQLQNWPNCRPH